jgi:hypothetical protein
MHPAISMSLTMLWLLPANINGQGTRSELKLYSEKFNIAVDPQKGDYVVLAPDCFYLFHSSRPGGWNSFKYRVNELDTQINQPGELNFIHNSKQVLFVAGGGGQVYVFRDSSILRLDNSFLQKNQFGACGFEYEDKICLYSGYGFYSYKPYITEFSEKTKEWFLRPYAPNQRLPKGRQAVVYQIDKELGHFYMSSGYTLENPYSENVQNQDLHDVWRFDLKENSWKLLGYIKENNKIKNLRFPFMIRDLFYAIEKGPNNAVVKIDIKNNSIKRYKTDHLVDRILLDYGAVYHAKDHQIIAVVRDKEVDGGSGFSVVLLRLEELEHHLLTSGKYYVTFFDRIKPFIIIMLGLVGTFLYRIQWKKRKELKKKNKKVKVIVLEEDQISFEGMPVLFEGEHLAFLHVLLGMNGEISNNELLEYLRKGQESMDTLKKRKLKLISDINQIFKLSTGLSDAFLLEIKDDNDRRYKDYRVNPIFRVKT